jgi:hypothetical protein
MRIAIFVAVVAAHIALVWYFLTLWHLAASGDEDQSTMTMVFLPPLESESERVTPEPELAPPETAKKRDAWRAPLLYRSWGGLTRVAPMERRATEAQPSKATTEAAMPAPPPPNWSAEAEIVAQAEAQHIVESEDRAARQAGALTAMIKPLAGPHVPGPSFHWDPNPRYRWQRAPGGGFVIPLNDHCEIFVLIFVWAGCTIGELPPARGDLFKNMHPPVKFGDWDWRRDDP